MKKTILESFDEIGRSFGSAEAGKFLFPGKNGSLACRLSVKDEQTQSIVVTRPGAAFPLSQLCMKSRLYRGLQTLGAWAPSMIPESAPDLLLWAPGAESVAQKLTSSRAFLEKARRAVSLGMDLQFDQSGKCAFIRGLSAEQLTVDWVSERLNAIDALVPVIPVFTPEEIAKSPGLARVIIKGMAVCVFPVLLVLTMLIVELLLPRLRAPSQALSHHCAFVSYAWLIFLAALCLPLVGRVIRISNMMPHMAIYMICFFIFAGLLGGPTVAINLNNVSTSGPTRHSTKVIVTWDEVHNGTTSYRARLAPWGDLAEPVELRIEKATYVTLKAGDDVEVTTRVGLLGEELVTDIQKKTASTDAPSVRVAETPGRKTLILGASILLALGTLFLRVFGIRARYLEILDTDRRFAGVRTMVVPEIVEKSETIHHRITLVFRIGLLVIRNALLDGFYVGLCVLAAENIIRAVYIGDRSLPTLALVAAYVATPALFAILYTNRINKLELRGGRVAFNVLFVLTFLGINLMFQTFTPASRPSGFFPFLICLLIFMGFFLGLLKVIGAIAALFDKNRFETEPALAALIAFGTTGCMQAGFQEYFLPPGSERSLFLIPLFAAATILGIFLLRRSRVVGFLPPVFAIGLIALAPVLAFRPANDLASRPDAPDIAVILLGGVRADHLRALPLLEEFARQSVTFDSAVGITSDKTECLRALLAADFPSDTLGGPGPFHQLRRGGYQTTGTFERMLELKPLFKSEFDFVTTMDGRDKVAGRVFGLGARFFQGDDIRDLISEAFRFESHSALVIRIPLWRSYDRGFLDELEKNHRPGTPLTSEEAERVRTAYWKDVQTTDTFLREILEVIKREAGDSCIIAIVGDRGWPLGEDGNVVMSDSIQSEGVARVPMMISGIGAAGQHIGLPVSVVDLLPTLLDAVGVAPAGGKSLLPMIRGESGSADARTRIPFGIPPHRIWLDTGGWRRE